MSTTLARRLEALERQQPQQHNPLIVIIPADADAETTERFIESAKREHGEPQARPGLPSLILIKLVTA